MTTGGQRSRISRSPEDPTPRVPWPLIAAEGDRAGAIEDEHGVAKAENRPVIALACTTCRERTYSTRKNKKNDPGRLELNKFCPRCRDHTLHREAK